MPFTYNNTSAQQAAEAARRAEEERKRKEEARRKAEQERQRKEAERKAAQDRAAQQAAQQKQQTPAAQPVKKEIPRKTGEVFKPSPSSNPYYSQTDTRGQAIRNYRAKNLAPVHTQPGSYSVLAKDLSQMNWAERMAYGRLTGQGEDYYNALSQESSNPGYKVYDPYFENRSTLQWAIDAFNGQYQNFDDKFFQETMPLQDLEIRLPDTLNISKSGMANWTQAQLQAYARNKLEMAREDTEKGASEWSNLMTRAQDFYKTFELGYGRAPTAEEFEAQINMDDYPTLKKIDESRNIGAVGSSSPVILTRGIGYSHEKIPGLYEALRNGKTLDPSQDYTEDAIQHHMKWTFQPGPDTPKPAGRYTSDHANNAASMTPSQAAAAKEKIRTVGNRQADAELTEALYAKGHPEYNSYGIPPYTDDAYYAKMAPVFQPIIDANVQMDLNGQGTFPKPGKDAPASVQQAYLFWQRWKVWEPDTKKVESQWAALRNQLASRYGSFGNEVKSGEIDLLAEIDWREFPELARFMEGSGKINTTRPIYASEAAIKGIIQGLIDGKIPVTGEGQANFSDDVDYAYAFRPQNAQEAPRQPSQAASAQAGQTVAPAAQTPGQGAQKPQEAPVQPTSPYPQNSTAYMRSWASGSGSTSLTGENKDDTRDMPNIRSQEATLPKVNLEGLSESAIALFKEQGLVTQEDVDAFKKSKTPLSKQLSPQVQEAQKGAIYINDKMTEASDRPVVKVTKENLEQVRALGMKDAQVGSYMSLASQSFTDAQGHEVLISPIMKNGELYTQEELDRYKDYLQEEGPENIAKRDVDGLIIGIFNSREESDKYAELLHSYQAAQNDETKREGIQGGEFKAQAAEDLDTTKMSKEDLINALKSVTAAQTAAQDPLNNTRKGAEMTAWMDEVQKLNDTYDVLVDALHQLGMSDAEIEASLDPNVYSDNGEKIPANAVKRQQAYEEAQAQANAEYAALESESKMRWSKELGADLAVDSAQAGASLADTLRQKQIDDVRQQLRDLDVDLDITDPTAVALRNKQFSALNTKLAELDGAATIAPASTTPGKVINPPDRLPRNLEDWRTGFIDIVKGIPKAIQDLAAKEDVVRTSLQKIGKGLVTGEIGKDAYPISTKAYDDLMAAHPDSPLTPEDWKQYYAVFDAENQAKTEAMPIEFMAQIDGMLPPDTHRFVKDAMAYGAVVAGSVAERTNAEIMNVTRNTTSVVQNAYLYSNRERYRAVLGDDYTFAEVRAIDPVADGFGSVVEQFDLGTQGIRTDYTKPLGVFAEPLLGIYEFALDQGLMMATTRGIAGGLHRAIAPVVAAALPYLDKMPGAVQKIASLSGKTALWVLSNPHYMVRSYINGVDQARADGGTEEQADKVGWVAAGTTGVVEAAIGTWYEGIFDKAVKLFGKAVPVDIVKNLSAKGRDVLEYLGTIISMAAGEAAEEITEAGINAASEEAIMGKPAGWNTVGDLVWDLVSGHGYDASKYENTLAGTMVGNASSAFVDSLGLGLIMGVAGRLSTGTQAQAEYILEQARKDPEFKKYLDEAQAAYMADKSAPAPEAPTSPVEAPAAPAEEKAKSGPEAAPEAPQVQPEPKAEPVKMNPEPVKNEGVAAPISPKAQTLVTFAKQAEAETKEAAIKAEAQERVKEEVNNGLLAHTESPTDSTFFSILQSDRAINDLTAALQKIDAQIEQANANMEQMVRSAFKNMVPVEAGNPQKISWNTTEMIDRLGRDKEKALEKIESAKAELKLLYEKWQAGRDEITDQRATEIEAQVRDEVATVDEQRQKKAEAFGKMLKETGNTGENSEAYINDLTKTPNEDNLGWVNESEEDPGWGNSRQKEEAEDSWQTMDREKNEEVRAKGRGGSEGLDDKLANRRAALGTGGPKDGKGIPMVEVPKKVYDDMFQKFKGFLGGFVGPKSTQHIQGDRDTTKSNFATRTVNGAPSQYELALKERNLKTFQKPMKVKKMGYAGRETAQYKKDMIGPDAHMQVAPEKQQLFIERDNLDVSNAKLPNKVDTMSPVRRAWKEGGYQVVAQNKGYYILEDLGFTRKNLGLLEWQQDLEGIARDNGADLSADIRGVQRNFSPRYFVVSRTFETDPEATNESGFPVGELAKYNPDELALYATTDLDEAMNAINGKKSNMRVPRQGGTTYYVSQDVLSQFNEKYAALTEQDKASMSYEEYSAMVSGMIDQYAQEHNLSEQERSRLYGAKNLFTKAGKPGWVVMDTDNDWVLFANEKNTYDPMVNVYDAAKNLHIKSVWQGLAVLRAAVNQQEDDRTGKKGNGEWKFDSYHSEKTRNPKFQPDGRKSPEGTYYTREGSIIYTYNFTDPNTGKIVKLTAKMGAMDDTDKEYGRTFVPLEKILADAYSIDVNTFFGNHRVNFTLERNYGQAQYGEFELGTITDEGEILRDFTREINAFSKLIDDPDIALPMRQRFMRNLLDAQIRQTEKELYDIAENVRNGVNPEVNQAAVNQYAYLKERQKTLNDMKKALQEGEKNNDGTDKTLGAKGIGEAVGQATKAFYASLAAIDSVESQVTYEGIDKDMAALDKILGVLGKADDSDAVKAAYEQLYLIKNRMETQLQRARRTIGGGALLSEYEARLRSLDAKIKEVQDDTNLSVDAKALQVKELRVQMKLYTDRFFDMTSNGVDYTTPSQLVIEDESEATYNLEEMSHARLVQLRESTRAKADKEMRKVSMAAGSDTTKLQKYKKLLSDIDAVLTSALQPKPSVSSLSEGQLPIEAKKEVRYGPTNKQALTNVERTTITADQVQNPKDTRNTSGAQAAAVELIQDLFGIDAKTLSTRDAGILLNRLSSEAQATSRAYLTASKQSMGGALRYKLQGGEVADRGSDWWGDNSGNMPTWLSDSFREAENLLSDIYAGNDPFAAPSPAEEQTEVRNDTPVGPGGNVAESVVEHPAVKTVIEESDADETTKEEAKEKAKSVAFILTVPVTHSEVINASMDDSRTTPRNPDPEETSVGSNDISVGVGLEGKVEDVVPRYKRYANKDKELETIRSWGVTNGGYPEANPEHDVYAQSLDDDQLFDAYLKAKWGVEEGFGEMEDDYLESESKFFIPDDDSDSEGESSGHAKYTYMRKAEYSFMREIYNRMDGWYRPSESTPNVSSPTGSARLAPPINSVPVYTEPELDPEGLPRRNQPKPETTNLGVKIARVSEERARLQKDVSDAETLLNEIVGFGSAVRTEERPSYNARLKEVRLDLARKKKALQEHDKQSDELMTQRLEAGETTAPYQKPTNVHSAREMVSSFADELPVPIPDDEGSALLRRIRAVREGKKPVATEQDPAKPKTKPKSMMTRVMDSELEKRLEYLDKLPHEKFPVRPPRDMADVLGYRQRRTRIGQETAALGKNIDKLADELKKKDLTDAQRDDLESKKAALVVRRDSLKGINKLINKALKDEDAYQIQEFDEKISMARQYGKSVFIGERSTDPALKPENELDQVDKALDEAAYHEKTFGVSKDTAINALMRTRTLKQLTMNRETANAITSEIYRTQEEVDLLKQRVEALDTLSMLSGPNGSEAMWADANARRLEKQAAILESDIIRMQEAADLYYRDSTTDAMTAFFGNSRSGGSIPTSLGHTVMSMIKQGVGRQAGIMRASGRWVGEVINRAIETNPERIVENFLGKYAPIFNRVYIDSVADGNQKIKTTAERFYKAILSSGITLENEAIAHQYAEGRITFGELMAARPNDYKQIDEGIQTFRKIYDELIDDVNQTLTRNGFAPVPKRKNYFPHFKDGATGILSLIGLEENQDNIAISMIGKTDEYRPLRQFVGNFKARTGNETDFGLITGAMRYIPSVLQVIHQTNNIVRLRQLEEMLSQTDTNDMTPYQDRRLKHFKQYMMNYTNNISGKKTGVDVLVGKSAIGREGLDALRKIKQYRGLSLTFGSPTVILSQLVSLGASVAVAPTATAMAMAEMLHIVKDGDKAFDRDAFEMRSQFLTRKYMGRPIPLTAWDNLMDKGQLPAEHLERIISNVFVRACYLQNIREGMADGPAMELADKIAWRAMSSRNKGETGIAYGNVVGGTVLQFGREAINNLMFIVKDMPRLSPDRRKNFARIALLLLYNWLFNKLTGKETALDPIGAVEQKALHPEEGDNAWQTAGKTLSALADTGWPISYDFTNGAQNLPVVAGVRNIGTAVANFNWSDPTAYERIVSAGLGFVPGGAQIERTYRSLKTYAKGYSESNLGDVQFPVTQNPADLIAFTLLGTRAYGIGRWYNETNRKPLTNDQQEEFYKQYDAGIAPRAAFDAAIGTPAATRQTISAKNTAKMGDERGGYDQEKKASEAREALGAPSGMPGWAYDDYASGDARIGKAIKAFGASNLTGLVPREIVDWVEQDGKRWEITEENRAYLEDRQHKWFRAYMDELGPNPTALEVQRAIAKADAKAKTDFLNKYWAK